MMDVTVNGMPRQEMHVDGGATTQVFLYPSNAPLREAPQIVRGTRRVAWIIRTAAPRSSPKT